MTSLTRSTASLLIAALGATLACQFGACSSSESAGFPSGTPDGEPPDAKHSPPRADSSPRADGSEPSPALVPEGWVAYDDYDPDCGFYIPSRPELLPEPIRWRPCAESLGDAGVPGPEGVVCQRMVTDWTPGTSGMHILTSDARVSPDGNVTFAQRRFVGKSIYELVVTADGPVQNALLWAGGCRTGLATIHGRHVLYRIYDHRHDPDDYSGGLIGWESGQEKPRVLIEKGHKPSSVFSHQYSVGDTLFVENVGPDRVFDLATTNPVATISNGSDDGDLLYARYRFQGDDLFWIGESSTRAVVKTWTRQAGPRTLVGHGADPTRASNGFGTDGVDMVWMEASGRPDPNTLIYSNYETWTAKYTTNPQTLEATKRRVRSEPAAYYGADEVVGCGYAAHKINVKSSEPTWPHLGIRLVRLADGVSWELLPNTELQFYMLTFDSPLAITCEELFIGTAAGSEPGLVRIRIDSLGPGIQPD
jgi:hypothetical protein